MRYAAVAFSLLTLPAGALLAQDYTGPIPPKTDVPYLLHASNLVETEVAQATVKDRKDDEVTYQVAGESSSARTPLAEPIFLFRSDKIRPEAIEMYQFEVRRGNRELKLKDRPKGDDAHPLHLMVKRIEGDLYRIEADEVLENGEYSLSPNTSDDVFTFEIY